MSRRYSARAVALAAAYFRAPRSVAARGAPGPGRSPRAHYPWRVRKSSSATLVLVAFAAGAGATLSACGADSRSGESPSSAGAQQTAQGGQDGSGGATSASGGVAGAPVVPAVCDVKLPTSCPSPAPTYADVQPIFAARCVVCHSGTPNGPWPLTTYGHVATWRDSIRTVLATCAMPPVDSGLTLPPEEGALILDWIRCGMPP